MSDAIDVEVEVAPEPEAETALVVSSQQSMQLGGFSFQDDESYMAAAQQKATLIRQTVERAGCIQNIQGKKYVKVEGWDMLAQICGARAIVTSVESLDDGSYLASAELRATDGRLLQTAQMLCGDKSDPMWANRPKYAKLSMVQTRVRGKVCRMEFGALMAMGGLLPTPAEEMTADEPVKVIDPQPEKIDAIVRNALGIGQIKASIAQYLETNDAGYLETAGEAWDEITDEDKIHIHKSVPGKGGVFDSAEKGVMKSTEFRLARPSCQEAALKEQGERDAWDADLAAADAENAE